jgi:hypothetical protein
VLAIVLTTSIADIGRSIFVFNLFNLSAPLTPCDSNVVIYDNGVDNKVASSTEHMPETTRAKVIYVIISSIFYKLKFYALNLITNENSPHDMGNKNNATLAAH